MTLEDREFLIRLFAGYAGAVTPIYDGEDWRRSAENAEKMIRAYLSGEATSERAEGAERTSELVEAHSPFPLSAS
jgi:hypothetical protein